MSFKTRSVEELIGLCRRLTAQPQLMASSDSPAMISALGSVCDLLLQKGRGNQQIEELVRQVRAISVGRN